MFQSTRPRGARPGDSDIAKLRAHVSIHAPTRGATTDDSGWSWADLGFNPRAHEGRDDLDSRGEHVALVSIHAPTRGATTWPAACRATRKGINPRAHEGRDTRCSGWASRDRGFNPRAHEGRDDESRHRRLNCVVSIHAPTRGATRRRPAPCRWRPCFNPRAHEGRDQDNVRIYSSSQRFQSTRPRGARHRRAPRGARWRLVSIHAPTRGATRLPRRTQWRESVSIHAPTRGATRHGLRGASRGRVSIHAPTRGATLARHVVGGVVRVSIHAPTRGATGLPCQAAHGQDVSIHAPTRGATTRACCCCRSRIGFNPRAHEGRDAAGIGSGCVPRGFNPRAHEGRDEVMDFAGLHADRFQSTRPRGARRAARR